MKTFLLAYLLVCLLAPALLSAQVTVPVMADASHRAADRSFGPVFVPNGATQAYVSILRGPGKAGRLNDADTLTVAIELSKNGGISYEPSGGAVFNSTKQPADFFILLPEPSNSGRVLRGRFTLYGSDWKGSAAIILE